VNFTQQHDTASWCMGVALDSHISSEMQRLQLVPIMQPFSLFHHPSCCISPINSSCAAVVVV